MEAIGMILISLGIIAVPIGLGIWIFRAIKKKGRNWIGWGTALAGLLFFIVGFAVFPTGSTEEARQLPTDFAESGNESTASTQAVEETKPPEPTETPRPTHTSEPTETPEPTNTPAPPTPTFTPSPVPPTPTPTPIPLVDITPQEIKRVNTNGTEYQWEQLKREIIGKRIIWQGQVSEVGDDRMLRLHFPGTAIYVDAGIVSDEEAATLIKGQPVTIEARVLDLSRFLVSADLELETLNLEY